MNRAFVVGYYGMRNAGDDALLTVSAWGARRFLRNDQVFASSSEIPTIHGQPVRALYPRHMVRGQARILDPLCERLLLRHDVQVIHGGGSCFHTKSHMDRQQRILRMAGSRKHCAAGVSIGPFRDKESEDSCAELMRMLSFVGVRDSSSYERLSEIAPDARFELTFDNAVLLPMAAGMESEAASDCRQGLGIAMCNYERFTGGDRSLEHRRISWLAEALRLCVKAGVLDRVVLLDFNSHPYYGDSEVHQHLSDLLAGSVPCEHVPYDGDCVTLMRRVAGLKGIVAMRLHASVFAYIAHTPALMLQYHEKCREWATTVGMPAQCEFDSSCFDAHELAERIRAMMDGVDMLPELDTEVAIGRSLRNWEWCNQ